MTTVVLVDDHKLVRQAVKRALTDNGFSVIGEAGDGEEGIRLVDATSPQIVMLDITMPVMDGLAALKIIKANKPDTRVIMLTARYSRDVIGLGEELAENNELIIFYYNGKGKLANEFF